MQKLDFNNDGKLVAFTDNGCTDGKSATTEVKGAFEVSADVVKFILAKEYDLPAALRIEMIKGLMNESYYKHVYCFIGNDRQQDVLNGFKQRLDEQQKELNSYRHQINELSNVEDELKSFRKAVDDFNRTRRFFERKVKI